MARESEHGGADAPEIEITAETIEAEVRTRDCAFDALSRRRRCD
jgi:hypothetical protein